MSTHRIRFGFPILLLYSLVQTAAGQSRPASADIPAASMSAQQMTAAATAFVASLRPEQRDAAVFAFTGENRTNWSNVPVYVHPRPGLRIRDLTLEQRRGVHALLRASLSSQGYEKLTGIMRLDSIHGARELAHLEQYGPAEDDRPFVQQEAESFGTGSYTVAVFGMPGRDSDWGWIIQGHHMAASFTVSGGKVATTPLFLGATPLVLEDGVLAGWSALSHEVTRGFELMAALDADQRAQAVEPGPLPGDVIYGVGEKGQLPEPSGLAAADMTARQRRLLRALVEEYVRNADFDVAEAQLDAIATAGWDGLRFAWRGPTDDPTAPLYYRVHGERVLIELLQRPNHIHTIVRDPGNDYGEAWLDTTLLEPRTAADRFEAATRAYQRTDNDR
jgi:hypothetical protein